MKRAISLVIVTGLMGLAPVAAASSAEAAGVKKYKNCTQLNKAYKHGVGKPGARDKTSGTPVTNFKRSAAIYKQNKARDRDKDGIACEKK